MSIAKVEVGVQLDPLVIESVDPEKMKLMAALLHDPNPIHFDVDTVRDLGMGDRVINQGPSNLSYVLNMVTRWAGGVDTLRSVELRLLGNVYAGERVECRGEVVAVDREAGLATVSVIAEVAGRPVVNGSVVVSLATDWDRR